MTAPNNIQIAFPKVTTGAPLSVPPAPETVSNAGLMTVAGAGMMTTSQLPATRKTLSCSALLQGDTLARAQVEAVKEYPNLLNNTAAFDRTDII